MSNSNIQPSNLPSSVPNATSAAAGTVPVATGSSAWTNRSLLPADVGIDLTTSVQPADIGAASTAALMAHTANISNPHAVTAAQVGITNSMMTALTALSSGTSTGSSSGIGGGLSNAMVYGNGSDGVCVFDGTATFAFATLAGSTYTLTRDCYLASGSTVSAGIKIEVACCRIFCLGQLTNAGTIQSNGVTATSQAAQTYTLAAAAAPLGRPGAGGAGGNKTTGTAGSAGAGAGAGGAGGQTSTYTVGAGGASAAITLPRNSMVVNGMVMTAGAWTAFGRGGGGGGGTGDATNTGGSGGTGAGLVLITAQIFTNTGAINAVGGNGAPGTAGNASGGGGGGGGLIQIVTARAITNTGTSSVAGGVGGAASGTGSAGAAGSAGIALFNLVLPLDTVNGSPYSWIYGTGSDGVCAFDGTATFAFATLSGSTYTLTRDCYLADGSSVASGVTVIVGVSNVTVNSQGFRIFCNGTLINNGTIHANGPSGTQSSAYNPASTAAMTGTISAPTRGGSGANTTGTAGFTVGGYQGGGAGGGGGAGTSAASRSNSTGGGGSNGDASYVPRDAMAVIGAAMVAGAWTMFGAGGSGGGGTADGTNAAGQGGGGGGFVLIAAVNLTNNGQIQAIGGNGGSCTVGACGGGGGGGGGMVLLMTTTIVLGSGAVNTSGGAGGTGTNTAAGSGSISSKAYSSTADGNGGTAGAILNLLIA